MANLRNVDTTSYLNGVIIPFCRLCKKAFTEVGLREGRVHFEGNCEHTKGTEVSYIIGNDDDFD